MTDKQYLENVSAHKEYYFDNATMIIEICNVKLHIRNLVNRIDSKTNASDFT